MYLVLGGVPGPRGWGVPGPRGCTWSQGVYLVWGVYLVPGGGVYLVLGGVPGPRGCTWFWGVYLVPGGVPGPRGVYLVQGEGVLGSDGVPAQVLPPCGQNDRHV